MLYIIVGNSGSGKSTLAKDLKDRGYNRIITYTTRPKRPGEIHGVDYFFIDREEFLKRYNNDEFIGPTKYAGNFYGTLKSDLEKAEKSKNPMIIIVDQNGLEKIKKLIPKAKCIYLDLDDSTREKRLEIRNENEETIKKRMKEVFDFSSMCDYKVSADKSEDHTLNEVLKIIKNSWHKNGRSERIWTSGFMVPNHARYQAALHPDTFYILQ